MENQEYREIETKCDECGIVEEFTSDNLLKSVGDDWEQTCTNYPQCKSEHATITGVRR